MSTNRWTWDVAGFNPRNSPSPSPEAALRRYSISSPHSPELAKSVLDTKLQKLKDNVKLVRDDYIELRQEACDLQEYSNAKLDRVTRYLGVLADKTRKLDQAALEAEARISLLIYEKKKLFNDLLTAKGNIKVFCRARPLFEDEGPSVVEFPDYSTIRVHTGDDNLSNPKKDFEFDSVYGPHVAQADLFNGVQPFVQSAFDGYNVSILAYGQTGSGKTFTMEGSRNDRGLYARCFEELFDLSNSEATSTSQYNFSVSAFDMYNDQVRDLLSEYGSGHGKVRMGSSDSFVDLAQEFVQNPMDFSKILKVAFQNRGSDVSMFNVSHLIVTIHIYFSNSVTDEKLYSKLTLVDLAGSETTTIEDDYGPRATDMLHVMKSLSALGDVLNALITKKEEVPYGNSMLTNLLADVLGGNSKSLMIVNISPNASNISQTLSSLNFSARASNAALSLGNRDTIVKWRDIANDERGKTLEREKEINDLKQEVLGLRLAMKHANDQCVLLFNEVQKAWKVSFTLQSDLKSENILLMEKLKLEIEQSAQLRNQVTELMRSMQDQNMKTQQRDSTIETLQSENILLMEKLKLEIEQSAQLRNQVTELMRSMQDQNMKTQQRDSTIETLQAKLKGIEKQLNEALSTSANGSGSEALVHSNAQGAGDMYSSAVTKRLEDELLKRDALIEKLHEENEKLFERLTEKSASSGSPQVVSPSQKSLGVLVRDTQRKDNETKGSQQDVISFPLATDKNEGALVKSGGNKKTTPAGEYLTSALNDFDPDQYEGLAAVSDGVNKILMLVLAAVIKAGASREHEILAEIRDAVFAFIRKMEPQRVMDTMLVSRVRILYIRSLLARSPELQSIKVPPVERFLEKSSSGHSRSSSRGSSPRRSPVRYESSPRNALVGEQIQGFKVNIKPEKKSKLSSVVLKIRGIDQESWRQHVTGGKLREITEEAKSFSVGNRALAALFVHTPAGELQRQIRNWLAENFDFLSVTDDLSGGTSGQLELLSTAIMDGWMAGLGAAIPPHTDALGQLLSEYAKRVYNSQLQHLKDIAGTLATEVAEDAAQVGKLRSALESVDHKRRKILQQMRSDEALLTLHDGGSPIRNPSTAAEDARLASLVSLDGILKQVKDVMRQSSVNTLSKSKKRSMIASLDELGERMPSLLDIDHPCAQRHIVDARHAVESVTEVEDQLHASKLSTDMGSGHEADVVQWNVLQFNTGPTTTPFIVKCGANSSSELVVKADARIQEPKGGEIVRVVPRPTILETMNLEEMKELFAQLPEALSLLALARTSDGTRARYSRLYRTLAMKVPALRDLIGELEKGGALKDTRA